MDNIYVIILGVLEGLTEFMPVSSTGHLIILERALGLEGQNVDTFSVFIQLGAILAVVVLYFKTFISLFDFSRFSTDSFSGLSGMIKLGLACAPAFILGALFHSFIKEKLFSPLNVAYALIVWGLVMIFVECRVKKYSISSLANITCLQAFGVGVFQCFSLYPGVSRSGSTIIGGILLGLTRQTAAEFSFILAVPVMFAATIFDLYKNWSYLSYNDLFPFILGFVVSFGTAILAIKFFIALLNRWTLIPFALYRIALGLIVTIYFTLYA